MSKMTKNDNYYFPAYFKDWGAIRDFVTPEQGWTLFTMCLDYASGKKDQFSGDPVISAFFKLLSGGIDRSYEKRDKKVQKNRYARYCGVEKNLGREPLSLEDWIEQIDECQHTSTDDDSDDNHNQNRNQESKSESEKSNPAPQGFVIPAVEDVRAYCTEQGYHIDPQAFVDFYQAKGWRIGGDIMIDWRACVRSWERRAQSDKPVDITDPASYAGLEEMSL